MNNQMKDLSRADERRARGFVWAVTAKKLSVGSFFPVVRPRRMPEAVKTDSVGLLVYDLEKLVQMRFDA